MEFRVDIFSVALPSAPTLAGIQYFGKGYYLYLLGILVKGTTFTIIFIHTFYALTCRDIYRDIEPDLKQILFISFFCYFVFLVLLQTAPMEKQDFYHLMFFPHHRHVDDLQDS